MMLATQLHCFIQFSHLLQQVGQAEDGALRVRMIIAQLGAASTVTLKNGKDGIDSKGVRCPKI